MGRADAFMDEGSRPFIVKQYLGIMYCLDSVAQPIMCSKSCLTAILSSIHFVLGCGGGGGFEIGPLIFPHPSIILKVYG